MESEYIYNFRKIIYTEMSVIGLLSFPLILLYMITTTTVYNIIANIVEY